MIQWLTLYALPFIISLALSRAIIHYFGKHLLDTPNLRSSHQIPTPRGGGIALACGVVITLIGANDPINISPASLYWLLLPAGLIAILGICDDLWNLKISIRLSMQFLLAGVGIFLIGVNQELSAFMQLSIAFVLILFAVWMTNLYNFMDGINGLAALEAISVCTGMALVYWIIARDENVMYVLIIIATSTCGFLLWNFPKAKLFMGDSGSLFLGISFGLLAIESINTDIYLFAAWLIMLGVFIVDSSYTLFYRLITRQAVQQAHRTHAYQKMAIKYHSHTYVTLTITTINLLWLMPIAIAVATGKLNYIVALLIAYTPLLLMAHKAGAGRAEKSAHQ